jgi:hypothetical protein
MNTKVKIIFLFTILICIETLGQSSMIDKGSRVLLSTSKGLNTVSFYVYNPPFAAKSIYKDTIQAVNKYPEQLMSSVISTLSQEWMDYNTLGGKQKSEKKQKKYFDFISSMDKDQNYFELRSKLMFTLNNDEFAITKFYFHSIELAKPQSGSYVLQKVNGRWYTTSNPATSDLALMIMRFQESKLFSILTMKKDGNKNMDDLITLASVNGTVSLDLLIKEFSRWYSDNETQKLDYFIDQNAW